MDCGESELALVAGAADAEGIGDGDAGGDAAMGFGAVTGAAAGAAHRFGAPAERVPPPVGVIG